MTAILIAGATGLVGGHVLRLALADSRVERVVAPTRRALPQADKLTNPVLDFTELPDADWWAVDGVVCALGTTRRQAGSRQAFRHVDQDLPLAIARATRAKGATAFALTSSVGADPASRYFYLRVKGEVETGLADCGFDSLTIVRPAGLLGDRPQSRANEWSVALSRVVSPLLPRRLRPVRAERVAAVLLDAAATAPPGRRVRESETL